MARNGIKTGGGSRKGIPNKRSAGIEAFARSIVENPDYQTNLLKRAQGGELAPPVETMLFAYAYGKPTEQARDDQVFIEQLLAVVLKYADTPAARQDIRAVIEAHTTGGPGLRAVA